MDFPPELAGAYGSPWRVYCFYRSTINGEHQPKQGLGWSESMLEVVVEHDTGNIVRFVLVSVLRARYRDYDPGPVEPGNILFDYPRTHGYAIGHRDRVAKGSNYIDQYEQYEVWIGDHRITILFEGRVIDKSIQVGDHLIVFIDSEHETVGFQFTNITDQEMEQIIDTITFPDKTIAHDS
jgi:hypothetical protein